MRAGRFVSLLVLALAAGSLAAQPADGLRADSSAVAPRPVPEAALERFRADGAFAYDREPPPAASLWDVVRYWILRNVIEPWYRMTSQGTRDVVFYGLLLLVAGFALYRLFGADRAGLFRRHADPAPLDQVLAEEGIEAVDLAAAAEEAARAGRHREAVRLLYLRALQALAAAGRIRWAADKTNREYLAELRGTALEPPFEAVTRLFERAWYGHLPVDPAGVAEARALVGRLSAAVDAAAEAA